MNRRVFLQTLAALPAAAATAPPDFPFPKSARERLAVASYPFRKDVNPRNGTIKLLDFPKMVVDRFNVRGIEPLDEHFPSMDEAYVGQLREALAKVNAHVVNIPVGRLHGSFYDPDEQKRAAAMASAKKWIDVAFALGSPGIRVHVQGVKGLPPNVERTAASLKHVAEYGAQKRIAVTLENDDPSTEDALFLVDVMDRAASPWLRALPDFCNSMLLNKGEDYNYRAVTAMFQRAYSISHVKEIETDNGKVYRVDLAKTFAIAKAAGYRGFFSIEWDSDGDPYAGTQHLIDGALQALA